MPNLSLDKPINSATIELVKIKNLLLESTTSQLDDGAKLPKAYQKSMLKTIHQRDWHISFADYLARTGYFFLIPRPLRGIKAPIQHFISLSNQ